MILLFEGAVSNALSSSWLLMYPYGTISMTPLQQQQARNVFIFIFLLVILNIIDSYHTCIIINVIKVDIIIMIHF